MIGAPSSVEFAVEPYDFADFEPGDDALNAVEAAAMEAVRGTLRDAFRAFVEEGEWTLDGDGVRWEMSRECLGRSGPDRAFWGDGLPVLLEFRREHLVAAVRAVGGGHRPMGGAARRRLLGALDRWRDALDDARRAVEDAS